MKVKWKAEKKQKKQQQRKANENDQRKATFSGISTHIIIYYMACATEEMPEEVRENETNYENWARFMDISRKSSV